MTRVRLRAYAVARSLFRPTTLGRAVARLGYVQADPIRAPARAQDLILRHRVKDYAAGDLEARYPRLPIEEDFFINYGFVSQELRSLMHPRPARVDARGEDLLEFVRGRGVVHPREVDAHFAHGTVTNYWGGSSNATTHLMDGLHYQGLLRVVRREAGIRLYAVREPVAEVAGDAAARLDSLIDTVVGLYAPVPASSIGMMVARLRYAAPQLKDELKAGLARAKARLGRERVERVDWFWPAGERVRGVVEDRVRFLAPFDPVVWDRKRFELFWGWAYRFEAYTPVSKRKLGYYALPVLWRDDVMGWANVAVDEGGRLTARLGYIAGAAPRDRAFRRGLEEELAAMSRFLGLAGEAAPVIE